MPADDLATVSAGLPGRTMNAANEQEVPRTMRQRFRQRTAFGVVAGVAATVAVAWMGSVGAAVLPTGDAASAKQYEPKKITICHRTGSKKNPWRTITVSQNALKAHLKHGDVVGACPTAVFTLCHATKNGKAKTLKVKGSKKAQRLLKKGDKLGKCTAKNKPGKNKQKGNEKQKGKKKGPKR
jgi:hypothetical protein